MERTISGVDRADSLLSVENYRSSVESAKASGHLSTTLKDILLGVFSGSFLAPDVLWDVGEGDVSVVSYMETALMDMVFSSLKLAVALVTEDIVRLVNELMGACACVLVVTRQLANNGKYTLCRLTILTISKHAHPPQCAWSLVCHCVVRVKAGRRTRRTRRGRAERKSRRRWKQKRWRASAPNSNSLWRL